MATLNEIIIAVAKARFPFPNTEKPGWHCYVNLPNKPLISLNLGEQKLYPHILVVDRASAANKYALAADVVTGDDFNNLPLARWAQIVAAVNSFYLFVPENYCQQIIAETNNANIFISGFRYYRQKDNEWQFFDCLK